MTAADIYNKAPKAPGAFRLPDPPENIIGGPDCTICHWDENAPPAFTDEMREIMEDVFQKEEISRQRMAREMGITTFARTHSSLRLHRGSRVLDPAAGGRRAAQARAQRRGVPVLRHHGR